MNAASPNADALRYHFLLGFLIERGVLTDRRYGNGTWSLQGIYGVDDSGLRGAGRTPEEALDNAIVAANLDPDAARKFWTDTHAALVPHAPGLNAASPDLLATLTQLCFVIRTGGDVLKACEGAEALIGKTMGGAS